MMNTRLAGVLVAGALCACEAEGEGYVRDQFMIGDVGPEMAAPPPMDMGRFPQACVDLVMRSVACGIVPGDQAAASLQVCADSDPARRADRVQCVADAPDCDGVLACLATPPVDAGPLDGGPPDAGPADASPADGAPADAAPDLSADLAPPPDQGPPVGACPPEWMAEAVQPRGEGRFEAVGSTEGAPIRAGRASCGGGAGDRVYRFTSPADGRWRFETLSDALDVDTVLSARSDCAAPGSELACNDDAADDQFTSAFELELAAGVPVWVVVDGLTNPEEGYAWQGPFRLVVTPVGP